MALYNTVVGIATVLGASVGGMIADSFSYQATFFTSGVFRAIALVVLFVFIGEPRRAGARRDRMAHQPASAS